MKLIHLNWSFYNVYQNEMIDMLIWTNSIIIYCTSYLYFYILITEEVEYFQEMVKEKKFVFSFDPTKKARFGVLPRYAKNEMLIRWFELPNCFIFHNGGQLVFTCSYWKT